MTGDPILEAFRRAAEDRVRGAAEIEERLISDLLALRTSWTRAGVTEGAVILSDGQPAMASLVGLAHRIGALDGDDLGAHFEQRLRALKRAPEALAAAAAPWIERAAVVISISRSSAVAGVVEAARRRGWNGTVVILDGSSAGGGGQQALRLGAVSQPDAAALRWLEQPEALVAVGADAVGPDRFINCVGTGMLLELARNRGVPSILVADRGKDVSEAGIDEMEGRAPPHRDETGREWPLFETIARNLVTARISD